MYIHKNNLFITASPQASEFYDHLIQKYPSCPPESADAIVALGGDGFMLKTLHKYRHLGRPVYGMNCGTVGFLMNVYTEDHLLDRINHAKSTILHPLKMTAKDVHGKIHEAFAINEVSLLRQGQQAAKIRISVDEVMRLEELVCDGVLLATPAGSTAYNFSAHGPIIPLGTGLLALTPISPFRPRRWRGALLPHSSSVRFDVLESHKRPVSVTADDKEVRDISFVEIIEDTTQALTLLFDYERNLEERIIKEQFTG